MQEALNKLETKLDKLMEIQMDMVKSQVRMEADIAHHIYRTDQLEDYIGKVTKRLATIEVENSKKLNALTIEVESAKKSVKLFAGAIALFQIIMQLVGKL